MTETDSTLAEPLLAERFAGMADDGNDADWRDVRHRARQMAPNAGTPRKRYPLAAAIALAISVPALAVAGIATGLIPGFRDTPAPFAVQESFTRLAARDLPSGAVAKGIKPSEAKGVLAVRTEAGTIRIWVAPTESGDRCRLLQIGKAGDKDHAFSCGPAVMESPLQFVPEDIGNGVILLDGRVGGGVTSVSVRLADGSSQSLPIVDSYFAGVASSDNRPVSISIDRGDRGVSTFPIPS